MTSFSPFIPYSIIQKKNMREKKKEKKLRKGMEKLTKSSKTNIWRR